MTFILTFLLILALSSGLRGQSEFSLDRATADLRVLSEQIGPRPMGSPAENAALRFAVQSLLTAGCDSAFVMPMNRTSRVNTTSGIAVGIKRGTTDSIICIGGHIDSAGPEIPGADDDASGSATVLETARILGQRSSRHTIVFCLFGGEEHGLEGSRYFVEHFPDVNKIALMLQIDMANGLGIIDMDPDTYGRSAPSWLVKAAAQEFRSLGYEHLRYPVHFFAFNYSQSQGAGSDHESFLKAGIPAIDFSTDVSKPIHTPRDIIAHVDPRGMKRSGDLVLRLVNRFDKGMPSRTTERYWLYLFAGYPVIVPLWLLAVVAGLSLLSGAFALVALYRRRPAEMSENPPRVSGLKIFLFCVIVAAFAWSSSDFLGLVKHARHPWIADMNLYYLLATFAGMLGVWISAHLAKRLSVTHNAFSLFRHAFGYLALYTILLSFASVKLALYPALTLGFLSAAALLRNRLLRLSLAVLAPLFFLRLIFSEWSEMIFRSAAYHVPSEQFGMDVIIDVAAVFAFTLIFFPVVAGIATIFRDSDVSPGIGSIVRSRWFALISLVGILVTGVVLLSRDSYNAFWFRDVEVTQRLGLDDGTRSITLTSSDYLRGVRLTAGNLDTLIDADVSRYNLDPVPQLDSSWVSLSRDMTTTARGDTTAVQTRIRLSARERPYTVSVSYSSRKNKNVESFGSPWMFRTDRNGKKTMEWYSFPDSVLTIPVSFSVVASDTIEEEWKVTFARLVHPVSVERKLTYVIPRTEFTGRHLFNR